MSQNNKVTFFLFGLLLLVFVFSSLTYKIKLYLELKIFGALSCYIITHTLPRPRNYCPLSSTLHIPQFSCIISIISTRLLYKRSAVLFFPFFFTVYRSLPFALYLSHSILFIDVSTFVAGWLGTGPHRSPGLDVAILTPKFNFSQPTYCVVKNQIL